MERQKIEAGDEIINWEQIKNQLMLLVGELTMAIKLIKGSKELSWN